jgi:dihydrofolate reductase
MARIVITEFISLDGVVEDPKPWTFEIDRGEEVEQFLLDEVLGTDALLLGRTTYEEFAAIWPSVAGAPGARGRYADRFNSLPKYVVSSRLEDPAWNNSTVLNGEAVEEVSRLKRELDGDVAVNGSIRLVRTLIEHDLVDELRLKLYPVVLGAGERLFSELPERKAVRLVDTKTVGNGIAILTYQPVRGTFRKSDK